MTRTKELGPLEMEVIGLLEQEEALSVSEIQKKLKKSGKDLAYTTVMTVLVRLFNKGFLKREKEGRQYLYSRKAKAASQMGTKLLSKMHKALFKNQKLKPILALLDSEEELSKEELLELKKIVDGKLKKK